MEKTTDIEEYRLDYRDQSSHLCYFLSFFCIFGFPWTSVSVCLLVSNVGDLTPG